jgi:uncharacterized YigZ family protein
MSELYRPKGEFNADYEVKGSRFQARCMPAAGEKEAKQLAAECRREFPDATHVVYAFRSGRRGDIFGFTDDGEPHGTAGRPVLEVMRGAELTEAVVLVVRWFGGTKLGTGGLVKAYTRAAQLVLEKTATEALVERRRFSTRLPYRLYQKGRELLSERGALFEREEFGEHILLTGELPAAEAETAAEELRDLSSGTVELWFDETDTGRPH